jgi:RNA polymerase sigma-70 factor (sigma-E family)
VRRESIKSSAADDGGPEDFDAFVAACSSHLYRTACLLTGGDTHLAEDLVQETLVRMCMKWGKRHGIGNPSGYAQTTLVNGFISMRRRKSSRELPSEHFDNPAAADADIDLRVTLISALGRLPELDRAVLVLRFWEDRSVEDTANILKLNGNTVRSRSLRALARLREQLGTDYIEFTQN